MNTKPDVDPRSTPPASIPGSTCSTVTNCTGFFYGTSRGDQLRVDIVGHQNADGTVSGRSIRLEIADLLYPAGARQLARHLIAAADEIERLAEAGR